MADKWEKRRRRREGEKVLTMQRVFLVRHDVIRVSGMKKLLRFKSTGQYGDVRD